MADGQRKKPVRRFSKKLDEREHGYELSKVEYALLYGNVYEGEHGQHQIKPVKDDLQTARGLTDFQRDLLYGEVNQDPDRNVNESKQPDFDNSGFVRFDGRSRKIFYLDASPFLHDPRKIAFVIEKGDVPDRNKLIEVTITESERKPIGPLNNMEWLEIRYVNNWKYVNPNVLIGKRSVMDTDEYLDVFKAPFADHYYLDDISHVLGMYTASSPMLGNNQKGGIDAAALVNDKGWKLYGNMLDHIPKEFGKTRSNNFYRNTESTNPIVPIDCSEVNVSYHNPQEVFVHMPFVLPADLKEANFYKQQIADTAPFARARMLDMLLFQPEFDSGVQAKMVDLMHEMTEQIKSVGTTQYKQDIGSAVLKFGTSLARLNLTEKVTIDHLEEGFNAWSEIYQLSLKRQGLGLSTDQVYKLSADAKILYVDLQNACDKETFIPFELVPTLTSIPEWNIDIALKELSSLGLIYFPNVSTGLKIVDI